jgi:hypothetical protein
MTRRGAAEVRSGSAVTVRVGAVAKGAAARAKVDGTSVASVVTAHRAAWPLNAVTYCDLHEDGLTAFPFSVSPELKDFR